MIASSRQIRAARTLLGWSQLELATRAGVSRSTLAVMEAGMSGRITTLKKIVEALEAHGIEFLNEPGGGEGVRLRPSIKGRGRD